MNATWPFAVFRVLINHFAITTDVGEVDDFNISVTADVDWDDGVGAVGGDDVIVDGTFVHDVGDVLLVFAMMLMLMLLKSPLFALPVVLMNPAFISHCWVWHAVDTPVVVVGGTHPSLSLGHL